MAFVVEPKSQSKILKISTNQDTSKLWARFIFQPPKAVDEFVLPEPVALLSKAQFLCLECSCRPFEAKRPADASANLY